jgi:GNAT superfamily N-acetyltransferase
MSLNIDHYSGERLAANISALAEFRLRYFREFPYLYAGTEEGEHKHIAEYIANPTARLILARETNNKIIGIAIGTMLATETEILRQIGEPLRSYNIIPEQCYYFGEMIAVSEYRHRGIGTQMLEALKNAGKEQDASRFCFLAVAREPDDPRRPDGHIDSDLIFRKFGFEKTALFVTFEWATIQMDGSVQTSPNRLDLWVNQKECHCRQ